MVIILMISSISAYDRRTHPRGKQNTEVNPIPSGSAKKHEGIFRKKTEYVVLTPGENFEERHDVGREIIVDQLICHIHHEEECHPHHIEHHLGEEALVPIELDKIKIALDSRLKIGGNAKLH